MWAIRPAQGRTCATEFARYFDGQGGTRWRCKRCVAEAVTRRHQAVRRALIEEAGGGCALCGYDRCVVSLSFQHVDPTTKLFPMAMSSGKPLATYETRPENAALQQLSRRS